MNLSCARNMTLNGRKRRPVPRPRLSGKIAISFWRKFGCSRRRIAPRHWNRSSNFAFFSLMLWNDHCRVFFLPPELLDLLLEPVWRRSLMTGTKSPLRYGSLSIDCLINWLSDCLSNDQWFKFVVDWLIDQRIINMSCLVVDWLFDWLIYLIASNFSIGRLFIDIFDASHFQAGGLTLLALGVYSAKMGTGVAARYVESRLGKPALVRETSRLTFFETLRHPVRVSTDDNNFLVRGDYASEFHLSLVEYQTFVGQTERCFVGSCAEGKATPQLDTSAIKNIHLLLPGCGDRLLIDCFFAAGFRVKIARYRNNDTSHEEEQWLLPQSPHVWTSRHGKNSFCEGIKPLLRPRGSYQIANFPWWKNLLFNENSR